MERPSSRGPRSRQIPAQVRGGAQLEKSHPLRPGNGEGLLEADFNLLRGRSLCPQQQRLQAAEVRFPEVLFVFGQLQRLLEEPAGQFRPPVLQASGNGPGQKSAALEIAAEAVRIISIDEAASCSARSISAGGEEGLMPVKASEIPQWTVQ